MMWMNTTYSHHRTALSRWSLRLSSSWIHAVGDIQGWAQVRESNQWVMLENARLRAELEALKSNNREDWSSAASKILRSPGWDASPWMVIDQGGRDGLRPHAAVLSMGHAAGKIVDTTAHESLVLTLAHPKAQWSVRIGRQGASGRLLAQPGNVRKARVFDIPWSQLVLPGDTVLTTGFDGVFPADIPVGQVEDVLGDESDEFQTVVVALGANYPSARNVICVQSRRNARLDSLKLTTPAAP